MADSNYEMRIDPLSVENLEELRQGYEKAFDVEEKGYQEVSSLFSRFLEQLNPDGDEVESFLQEFEREVDDEFLEGVYNGAIDYAGEEGILPLDIA